MREIKFEEIKELWKTNPYPVMMYIHSPFCKTNCTYCVYRGTTKYNEDEYNKYYYEYLPSQIDKYKEIIDSQYIPYCYFGGGNTSINGTLDHLIPTFEKIKDLKFKEKTIELHTGWEITDDQLKILKKHNFTTIILCVQSFDKNFLKKVNRCNFFSNDVDSLIGKIHKLDMNVGMDLMVLPDISIDSIKNDLEVLNSFKNIPDEISINLDYRQRDNNTFTELYNLLAYDPFLKSNMKTQIKDFTIEYLMNCKSCRFFSYKGLSLKNKDKFYAFDCYMEEGISSREGTATLGIGSYKNMDKWTYSNCGKYSYFEKCTNLDEEPEYYLTKELSFYDKVRNLLDWMESVCGPEASNFTYLSISNEVPRTIENTQEEYGINFNIQNASYYSDFTDKLNRALASSGGTNVITTKKRN